MRSVTRNRALLLLLVGIALAVGIVVAVVAVVAMAPERQYDPDFDTRVAQPAYSGNGPAVLFDDAHLSAHAPEAGYKPLLDLIRNDGYQVQILQEPITAARLADVAVLLIVCPRGKNDAGDEPAYTAAEIDAIYGWVRGGGSLLLITDHWPYGPAVAALGERFGVHMSGGFTQDPENFEAPLGDSNLVFSRANGLLGEHPITLGRSDAERIERVVTFTGQSLLAPEGGAEIIMALADTATDRPPGVPVVEKDGGDVRVSMEYGETYSAAGRAQGLALEVEKGRVVVLGESGMLRAHHDRDGNAVGMNYSGFDNRQLALNIMHWLSRLL